MMHLFHNQQNQNDSLNDLHTQLIEALESESEIQITTSNPQDKKNALKISTWNDLAECLDCSCEVISVAKDKPLKLLFRKTNIISFRADEEIEKYGEDSKFSDINKLEDPCFLTDIKAALDFIRPVEDDTVIDLGCNNGQLFKAFDCWDKKIAAKLNYLGFDHSPSAIAKARESFPSENYDFREVNLNAVDSVDIPTHNILMSVGTLQSPGVEGPAVFKNFYQSGLHKNGKVLLAFPNCKYTDSGLLYGARSKNFKTRDMSLLLKDCMYYKKYLQQHGYRVWITGKYYIFLAARKINKGEPL